MGSTGLISWVALGVGAGLGAMTWLAFSGRPPSHAEVVGNLSTGLGVSPRNQAIRPTSKLTDKAQRFVQPAIAGRLERLLTLAGHPQGWSVGRIVVAKLLLSVSAMAAAVFLISSSPTSGMFVVGAGTVAVAFFVPELLLYSRGEERQRRIQKELADTLDQMTISVEAGLGFDGAMARAASAGRGPLADEFTRTLQDLQVGVPRRDAFRALAGRTKVTDLRRFVAALLQADAYGVPLADTLRIQAEEIRRKRRARAEQKAMQVPVKVVFPLVVTILPTLFIVLLGPAILSLVSTFS